MCYRISIKMGRTSKKKIWDNDKKSSHVWSAVKLLNISKIYTDIVKAIVAKRKLPVQNVIRNSVERTLLKSIWKGAKG